MGYSKHEFECIPMAAVHTNTNTLRVRFSLIQLFLCGSCFHMSNHVMLLIYTAHSKDMA